MLGCFSLRFDFYFLTDSQRSVDGFQLNGTPTGARFTVEQSSSCDGEKSRSRLLLLFQLAATFARPTSFQGLFSVKQKMGPSFSSAEKSPGNEVVARLGHLIG